MKLSQKLIEKFELNEFYLNFPAVIFILKIYPDFTQECTFISENCSKLTGFSAHELIENWSLFFDRLPQKFQAIFQDKFHNSINGKNRFETKIQYRTPDSTVKWLKINANTINKFDYYEVQGIFTDITEEQFNELKDDRLKNALIHMSRHPIIHQGDLKNLGEFLVRLVAETIGVSRSSFWLYDEAENSLTCDILINLNSGKIEKGMKLNYNDFPDYFNALLKKPYITANDARNDMITSCFTKNYFIPNNIYSLLDIPIFHNGKVIGVLCQEETGKVRNWQKTEVNFLFQISEYISYCFAVSERNLLEEELSFLNKNLQDLIESRTKELKQKTLELERKNNEYKHNHIIAKEIQTSLLPTAEELQKEFSKVEILIDLSNPNIGNHYWFHANNNKKFLSVLETKNTKLSNPFFNLLVNKTIKRCINETSNIEIDQILFKTNQTLKNLSKHIPNLMDNNVSLGLFCFEEIPDKEYKVKFAGFDLCAYTANIDNELNIETLSNSNLSSSDPSPSNIILNEKILKKGSRVFCVCEHLQTIEGSIQASDTVKERINAYIQKNKHLPLEELKSNVLTNFFNSKDHNLSDSLVVMIEL